jgi:hypothetical protein
MSLLRTTRGGKTVDYSLSNGGVLLGTAPACQIVVADPAAAPKHCRIARSPQGFVVTDLSGTGGTLVNGSKVKEHVLKSGDVLQIGAEKFVFADQPVPVAAVKESGGASGSSEKAEPGSGPRRRLPSRPPPTPARASNGSRPSAPAPRKLTAKPGSVSRVHKDHTVFALPSTPKGKMAALGVGIGLAVVGAVLFVISSGTKNSDQIKKAAEADVERLNKIPEAEIEKRLQAVEEILANEDYQKYAKAEINLDRLRNSLREQVNREVQAAQRAKSFLERYKEFKDGPPDEYNRQADQLWDNVGVLYDTFKTTRFGVQLAEVRQELKEFLEKRGLSSWSIEFPKLANDVTKLTKDRNFSGAWILVDKFGADYKENDTPQLKSMLQGQRDRIKGTAKTYIDGLKAEASEKPSKEESRRHLEPARPFVKGVPDIDKQLEKYISEYQ